MTEPTPEPTPPSATRTLLTTKAEYADAINSLIALADREIRIFDTTLADYGFNTPVREEQIKAFLLKRRTNKLMIAVHDAAYITQSCPRLMRLLRGYSHAIEIVKTNDAIRHIEDTMIVIDDAHYARRPHQAQPNGVLVTHDAEQTRGWLNRFGEIHDQSSPSVSATTLGL
jgi:hypothetical protein